MQYYVGPQAFGTNELMHYGVLGMKWGVHKNPDYVYKSHATKKYERKIDKLSYSHRPDAGYKRDIWRNRLEKSKKLDARELRYAKRVSALGNIASRWLVSSHIGGKAYQSALSMLNGQDQSGVTKEKVLAFMSSVLGGRLGVAVGRALYVRSDEHSMD